MSLLLAGCGGGGSSFNPTPAIQSPLIPSSITAGSDSFTLFISGTGFVSSSKGVSFAYWNGSPRSTSYNVSTGQLSVSILKSDVAAPGIAQVLVANPGPGGGPASAPLSFTIEALQPGAPSITSSSFSPANATAGGQAFTLTVNGSNFAMGNYIIWNGSQKVTTWKSATQLTAPIDAVDTASPGFASVAVGTGNSATTSLSLAYPITGSNNAAPSLSSLAPSSATAGAPDLEVLVSGSGFVASSVVEWKSAGPAVPLATAFLSSSQLVALIPAADLAAAGSATMTVMNPAPGGGTSSSQTFTIH